MKVLIAEDDAVTRLILQATIESLGHVCLTADDGFLAWEIYKSEGADVLISDWLMPGLSGPELCRRVRAKATNFENQTSNPDAPLTVAGYTYFIILTALDDKAHLQRGIEAGVDDYLAKPLKVPELAFRLQVAARITALHQRMAEQTLELERLNYNLLQEVHKDGLTGLNNRLRLSEDLEVIKSEVARYGQPPYSAIMIDIDNFKQYNDTYGHQAGDEALKITAHHLLVNIRKEDTAYRYGGEEFLIILPHQNAQKAVLVAEKLRLVIQNLGIPHALNPSGSVITISAGVADLTPSSAWTLEEWLGAADQALYRAKQTGRNRTILFEK